MKFLILIVSLAFMTSSVWTRAMNAKTAVDSTSTPVLPCQTKECIWNRLLSMGLVRQTTVRPSLRRHDPPIPRNFPPRQPQRRERFGDSQNTRGQQGSNVHSSQNEVNEHESDKQLPRGYHRFDPNCWSDKRQDNTRGCIWSEEVQG